MELTSLDSLLEDQLKDLYSAENQLLQALPKMAERASSPKLRKAFEKHAEETRVQVDRLREIGDELGLTLGGKKCHAMEGIIAEGQEVLEADGDDVIIDAALIAAAQRAEHYEITGYGTARTFAKQLGHTRIVQTLQKTLKEESATDEKLTKISEDELLPQAMGAMHETEESPRTRARAGSRSGSGRTTGGRTATGSTRKSKPASTRTSASTGSRSKPRTTARRGR